MTRAAAARRRDNAQPVPDAAMSTVDEPIEFTAYDARWPAWYAEDAVEIARALGARLQAIEHFGSTAVPGMAAKPIVDVLVALRSWPSDPEDRDALAALGYEYLGESGVPGREYFRRRRAHSTNLAVVEWEGAVWADNLATRDYLRCHPGAALAYAGAKERAWAAGARTLLAYSAAKGAHMTALVGAARKWAEGRSAR
jgi:GrpB-like predicted nucleotidyltransferase (UPF0157 family)